MLPYSPLRPFEHPLLTSLFDALVRRGNWDEVEVCLNRAAYGGDAAAVQSAANSGSNTPLSPSTANLSRSGVWTQPWLKSMFSSYISRQIPKASWSHIHTLGSRFAPLHVSLPPIRSSAPASAPASTPIAPSGRGGHAMVFDSDKGIAYLFGGWDGKRDLSDLWAYHVSENRWRLISADTQLQGGPSPRSCHKMCLDEKSGCIYLLGRYVDYESANHAEPVPADSIAHPSRTTPAVSTLPVTPSSSTARTTRANFLARYPESIARDIQMILSDASPTPTTLAPRALAPPPPDRHQRPFLVRVVASARWQRRWLCGHEQPLAQALDPNAQRRAHRLAAAHRRTRIATRSRGRLLPLLHALRAMGAPQRRHARRRRTQAHL